MLVGLGCVIGIAVVIATVRAVRARNALNPNRMMRDYHWCPVKYFAFVDKRLDMKFLEGVPPKNDLN